ncbi:uncharacterized protein LOC128746453 [Sabethes cyaneus]|uniref:uncharacterized protein LOC128746453 n=1 Tax=Sabethes cyaneus TaxID=53552 RepID=UPI00237E14E6|nr:uncharacterized protein LOC128746453 [Sabethes cyaneus]
MLSSREISAVLGNTTLTRKTTKGCPQGGVLSPLLWSLVVDELLKNLTEQGFEVVGFADDVVILVRGKFDIMISTVLSTLLLLPFNSSLIEPPSADPFFSSTVAQVLIGNFQFDHVSTMISSASERRSSLGIVNDVLALLGGQLEIRLDRFSESNRLNYALFFDGYFSFRKVLQDLGIADDLITGRCLLVYCGEAGLDDELQRRIFDDLWRSRSVDVNLMWNNDSRVEIWTYFPYAKPYCGSVKPVLLRSFTPGSTESHLDLFPAKTSSFKGCPLKVGAFQSNPFMIFEDDDDASSGISGIEGDLLKLLAEKLDFTISIVVPPNNTMWGQVDGENSTGIIQLILDEEVDLGLSSLGLAQERIAILKPGVAHHVTRTVFVVPAGREFTSFEKLFGPLATDSWILIGAFTLVGLAVIGIVGVFSGEIQNFVYGRGVSTPYLNLFGTFFGYSITRLPGRNFARTILFLYIWFTMVLRSVYQGSLFKCLQNSHRYAPMSTLAEIERSSGLIYTIPFYRDHYLIHVPSVMPRVRLLPLVPDTILSGIGWLLDQPGSPDVLLSPQDYVARHNKLRGNRGSAFAQIARESLGTCTAVIYYPKRSILTPAFDRQIMRIQSVGLDKFWLNRYGDYQFFRQETNNRIPEALTGEHLLGAYEVYGTMLLGSSLVWALEMLSLKVRWLRKVFEGQIFHGIL